MIPVLPIQASSFRVFRGYRKADLTDDAFLKELGQTFLPGGPLMLRDLGLAAYLPAVLPLDPENPDLPHEVAIIAYSTREQYAWARENLVGRMYRYTHRAFFDMARSKADFPERIGVSQDVSQDAVRQFYVTGASCDWQADGDVVFWAGRKHDTVADGTYADKFLSELEEIVPTLRDAAVRECVGQAAPNWASLWFLLGEPIHNGVVPPEIAAPLARGLSSSTELMVQVVQRHLWREGPPPIDLKRPSSHSFIFQRDAKYFMR